MPTLMIMILTSMITILISGWKLRGALVGSILALLFLLTACDSPLSDRDDLHVVATTSIWGDVVSQIVGEDATVEVLITQGADAHDYEPTSRQVAALHEADLVIANGLGLEEGLEDVLESAEADGANIYEVAPDLDPIPFAAHEHEGEEAGEEDHDHAGLDPHVWFDLSRVDVAAGLIAQRLVGMDDSVDWMARAAEYSEDLLQADEEILRILDVVAEEDRKLVTNHEALGYFAARYGFEIIAVVIPGGSTLGEPSSADLVALVDEIEHEGVHTIFAETTQPTRLAEAVAAEVGEEVTVVELYTESLGEPGSDAGTLIGMVLTDARLVAAALSQ